MDIKRLEEFILLAKKNNVSNLIYENDGLKLSVSFETNGQGLVGRVPSQNQNEIHYVPQHFPDMHKNKDGKIDNLFEIKSPFVGTYYRSPSPGSEPYVKIGDKVKPGQVLCIVEAMKIMNEIESEISGTVEEICVDSETYVEFGQVIYRIRK